MTRVAVLGAGSWGTTFSMVLADGGSDVVLWGRRPEVCASVNSAHQNLDYLPGCPLSHIHVFPYSDRPGTVASGMTGKVDGAIVRSRGSRLRAVGAELGRRFRESQAGSTRPGLTLEDGTLVVTDNYLKVRIPPGFDRNSRVTVRLGRDSAAAVAVPFQETGGEETKRTGEFLLSS